jgi:hypothetical protein
MNSGLNVGMGLSSFAAEWINSLGRTLCMPGGEARIGSSSVVEIKHAVTSFVHRWKRSPSFSHRTPEVSPPCVVVNKAYAHGTWPGESILHKNVVIIEFPICFGPPVAYCFGV